MPPRWACMAIAAFWLLMSSLLFERDLAPTLFQEDLSYAAVLADKATDENIRWILRVDGRRVGTVHSSVKPQSAGGALLTARVRLTSNLLGGSESDSAPKIVAESEFHIGADQRLVNFHLQATIGSSPLRLEMAGSVEGNTLTIETKGVPTMPPVARFDFDPRHLVLNSFGPIDRLPDLWVGRRWTTRSVNPLSALLPAQGIFGDSIAVVEHVVESEEIANWGGRSWKCFKVRHRYDKTLAHSFVRKSDGRLLRQEVPLGIAVVAVELDPIADRWEAHRDAGK